MRNLGNSSKKLNIICFGDQWDEYFRRRQQIMIKMSNYELFDKVIYVELPLTTLSFLKFLFGKSLPKVTQAWKRVLKNGPLCKEKGVWIFTPIALLPDLPIKIVQRISSFIAFRLQLLVLKFYIKTLRIQKIILWCTHPIAANFIGKLGERMVCYDRTEDFAYKHDWSAMLQKQMRENDSKIIKRADVVFVQTKETWQKLSSWKKEVFLVPNAVDPKWVHILGTKPVDMRNIAHPILGYCGNINSRIDFKLLEYVISKHPEWSLVIIGHLGSGVKEVSLLKDLANVYFLGVKPYRELPAYLKNFDICLMPHKIDRFTESQSPLKLFDYLIAGKPIVSTNIAGVRDYEDVVKIGNTKEEFVFLIEEALFEDSEREVEKRQAIAKQNTWDIRVEEICKILEMQFSK